MQGCKDVGMWGCGDAGMQGCKLASIPFLDTSTPAPKSSLTSLTSVPSLSHLPPGQQSHAGASSQKPAMWLCTELLRTWTWRGRVTSERWVKQLSPAGPVVQGEALGAERLHKAGPLLLFT